MVKSGSLLLADAPSVKNPATEYAYLATLTGLICRGETAAARKLAGESPRYLKDGSRDTEFHFLEAFAYSPQQRAACIARKG
jgi:hypothetical protein